PSVSCEIPRQACCIRWRGEQGDQSTRRMRDLFVSSCRSSGRTSYTIDLRSKSKQGGNCLMLNRANKSFQEVQFFFRAVEAPVLGRGENRWPARPVGTSRPAELFPDPGSLQGDLGLQTLGPGFQHRGG